MESLGMEIYRRAVRETTERITRETIERVTRETIERVTKEVRQQNNVQNIIRLMKKLGFTLEDAMNFHDVSENEKPLYRQLVSEELNS